MATAKNIKGITIEIAGDTTKLGKALKGVNEQSKDLTASLKYVDKLLDLDPGNVELLEEKQKLLTEAVDTTNEKLETLKNVQDQIKRQYASGEIGQRAYLDFRAEVAKTEKQLQSLRGEADRTDAELRGMGEGASGVTGNLDDLSSAADGAVGRLGDLAGVLGPIAGGLAAGAAAVGAVGGIISETEESTREYREEMAKLDVAFITAGSTADTARATYHALYRVLGETDQSVEAAQQIALLADSTEDAVHWASLAPGLIARMGDALQPETFYENTNETYKLNEATGAWVQLLEATGVYTVDEFNTALQSLTTEQEKQSYMQQVATELLGDAADTFERYNRDVIAVRDADARLEEATASLGKAFAPLTTKVKNFHADVLEKAAPVIGDYAEAVAEIPDGWAKVTSDFDTWVKPAMRDGLELALNAFTESSGAVQRSARQMEEHTLQWSTACDGMYSGYAGAMQKIAGTNPDFSGAKTQTDSFAEGWGKVCDNMYGSYASAVDQISKKRIELPKPKVPKFTVSGEFNLQKNLTPDIRVTWHADGGIFTRPTLLQSLSGARHGVGEAGQEALLPLSSFYDNLEKIMARSGAGGTTVHMDAPQITVYQQADEDGEALALRVAGLLGDMFEQEVNGIG